MMQPAIFLDRDGTLNVDRQYVVRREDFVWIDRAKAAMKDLVELGFALVVVTNQSAIARGIATAEQVHRLHDWMTAELAMAGVPLTGVYYCPHASTDGCACRKPAPGLLLQAAREHRLDLPRSWMMGDKTSDIEAGIAAGLPHTVLVRSGKPLDAGSRKADYVCDSIFDTVPLVSASKNRAAAQL